MTNTKLTLTLALIFLLSISFASAIIVNSEYVTLYAGEEKQVELEISNNENFDIEDVSIALILDEIPFTSVGSSEKDLDDLDEDDDDSATFKIRASTDVVPGDYNIPYEVRYTTVETEDKDKKTGSFGIRVSAKTELDFGVEAKGESTDSGIVGREGKVSLEIINQGLGEIKSVSVQIFPEGFELLSKDKIFIGTVDADDTDLASFDVIYKTTVPILKTKITYKDFDNKEQTETVNLPFKVYTEEEALERGIIKKNNTGIYIGIIIVIIIAWIVWRKIKKRRKNRSKQI